MAVKLKYKTDDDFKFENDLDIPNFDFDEPETKDDRSPITKVARGAIHGAAENIFSTKTADKIIRQSMPQSYGDGLDLMNEAHSSLQSLYNTAAKEFKPAVNQLKQITKKVLPSVESKLPKSMAEKLKDWANGEKSYSSLSEEAQRTQSLMMEIGTIFEAQSQENQDNARSDEQREEFRQSLEQVRHKDNLNQLDAIRLSVGRLAAYQDSTLVNFQRRSLELQFRHYFATADILKEIKQSASKDGQRLDDIVKNTGLPDYAKLQMSERVTELMRNKFLNNVTSKITGSQAVDYLRQFTANVTKNVKEDISSVANLTNTVADAGGMLADNAEMMQSMGADLHTEAGGMLGGAISEFGLHHAMPHIKKFNEKFPSILKGGEKLRYGIDNAGHLINDHLQDDSKDWGMFDFAKQYLAKSAPGLGPDTSMTSDELSNIRQPAVYNNQANKSITEIIPGLLARIHREIKVLRTGNDSIGLMTYDYESNTFKDSKLLGKEIRESLVGKVGRESVNNKAKEVLKFIEQNGNQLTDSQKESVIKKVTELGVKNSHTSAEKMTRPSLWKNDPNSKEIIEIFKNLFETQNVTYDHEGKATGHSNTLRAATNQRKFSELVKNIPEGIKDSRAKIQNMINAGLYDVLKEAGVVTNTNSLNLNQLHKDMMQEPSFVDEEDNTKSRRYKRRINRSPLEETTRASREEIRHKEPNHVTQQTIASYSDSKIIEEGFKKLENSISKNNTVENTKTISETLLRIEQAVLNNISMNSVQLTPEQLAQALAGIEKNKAFLNRSVGDVIKGSLKGLGNLGLGVLKEGRKIGSRIDTGITTTYKTGKAIVGTTVGKTLDYFGDVYVKGEPKARLTRARMKAGEYVDERTGKVITSLHDITGTVKDIAGNTVLEASELKESFMKGHLGKSLANLVNTTVKTGFNLITDVAKHANNLYSTAFSLGLKAVKTTVKGTIKALIPVSDVYVKGDTEPTLFKWKFLRGLYVSKKTGKILNHQKDIDGVVMEDGNQVLSEEQLKKGLVDKDGKEIFFNAISVSGLVFKGAAFVIKKGFTFVKDIAGRLKQGMDGVFDVLANVFSGFTFLGKKNYEISKNQYQVQLEILELLKDRLPGRKKVFGDQDGDGIRDGSFEDIEKKKKEAQDKKEETKTTDNQTDKKKNGLMGRVSSLFDKLKGKKKDEDSDGTTIIGGLGGSAKEGVKDAGKVAGKIGRMGKLWNGVKTIGQGALAVSGLAGLAGGLGTVASGAVGVGGAVLGGAGSLIAGAGSLLWAGGAAALGLVSTPVVLGVLGIGAAYYGYKKFTKRTLSTLSTVRFAQYGFDKTEEDKIAGVFGLEDMLEPLVSINGGQAKIDESKMDLKAVFELFGIAEKDKDAIDSWKYWYENRFKGVFLGHMAVLKATHPGLQIKNIDSKLETDEKLKYLEATTLPGANYDLTTPPFAGQKRIRMTSYDVKAAIELAKEELKKDTKDKKTNSALGLLSKMSTAVSNNMKLAGLAASTALGIKPLTNYFKSTIEKPVVSKTANKLTLSASADYVLLTKNRLDALQSLRFKTYGLLELDQDKVKSLIQLETATQASIVFSGKVAKFDGDQEKILDLVKGYFGISGFRSPRGYAWMTWYKDRFLPTYLIYIQALYNATGKEDPKAAEAALMPQDQVSVANAVKSATGDHNGSNASVWEVTESPWEDYALNTDPDSVKGNYQSIVEVSKAKILGDTQAVAKAQKARIEAAQKETKPTGNIFKDTFNKVIDKFKNNTPYRDIDPTGKGVKAKGDFMTGETISHPGKGTGGDINKLSQPGKESGWKGMKDVITGAANMAGVDSKLMAAMASVESNFDPNAMPSVNGKTGKRASGAVGLYQFIPDTWNRMLKQYGNKYGIAMGTPATDARANALMGAEFMKENINTLKKAIKRPLTSTDLYMAHFLGAGGGKVAGAIEFLQALETNPTSIAAKLFPSAAQSNPTVFGNLKTGQEYTLSEIYQNFTNKLTNRLRQSGATDSDFKKADGVGEELKLGTSSTIPAPKSGLVLKIQRDATSDAGTFGQLTLPDGTVLQTLEPAWKNNSPQKSSIPPGKYHAVMKNNSELGNVYEVQGVDKRSGIFIRPGNFAGNTDNGQKSDTSGSILIGTKRSTVNGQPAVTGSPEAIGTLAQKLGGQPFTLETIANSMDQTSGKDDDKSNSPKVSPVSKDTTTSKETNPLAMVTKAGALGPKPSTTAKIVTEATSVKTPMSEATPAGSKTSTPSEMTSPQPQPKVSPVRVPEGFKGFDRQVAPKPAEIMAQNMASKSDLANGFDSVSRTLKDSLGVQNQSYQVLTKILEQIVMKTQAKISASDNVKASVPTTVFNETPKSVISMKRNN